MKTENICIIIVFCILLIFFTSPPVFAGRQVPIRIGTVDSGISSSAGINYVTGYNYITNTDNTEDDTGHGSALVAIISSISPEAELVPLKASGKGFMTTAEITASAI